MGIVLKKVSIKYWSILIIFVSTLFLMASVVIEKERSLQVSQAHSEFENEFSFMKQLIQSKLTDKTDSELNTFVDNLITQYNSNIITFKLTSQNGDIICDFNHFSKSNNTDQLSSIIYDSNNESVFIDISIDNSNIHSQIRDIYIFSHLFLLIFSIGLGLITSLALSNKT